MDPLVEEAIPRFAFAVFKRSVAVGIPFFEKHSAAILLTEIGTQSFFKAATEDHRRPSLLFPPAIQVTVAIAAGAAQILTDLRVAIDHRCPFAHRSGPRMCSRAPPSPPPGRRPRGFDRNAR